MKWLNNVFSKAHNVVSNIANAMQALTKDYINLDYLQIPTLSMMPQLTSINF